MTAQPSVTDMQTESVSIIGYLEGLMHVRGDDVRAWFEAERNAHGAPLFSSVDLRHAGYKIAPVDTNLFPAGFNHLSPAARARAVESMRCCVAKLGSNPKILVIPENHTRNLNYLDNLAALTSLIEEAGAQVHLGTLQEVTEPLVLQSASGHTVKQYPMCKEGSVLRTCDGFTPDLIVLNNDLTSGFPDVLRGITQPITPRPGLGWHRRRKSIHFEAYEKIARRFAETFSIDPWLITPESYKCGRVNFAERQGMDKIAEAVETVLARIRGHYARYGIEQEPYVYIKSDSGTYGMGIMTVRSGDELREVNKKIRNKMSTIKEGVTSTEVIVQEGVPTVDLVDGAPAEPMIYLVNAHLVGGAYRVNSERDALGNLNATGMRFVRMCDSDESMEAIRVSNCSLSAFSIVAGLASLATSHEEYGENYSI